MPSANRYRPDTPEERTVQLIWALERRVFRLCAVGGHGFELARLVEDRLNKTLHKLEKSEPTTPEAWLVLGDHTEHPGNLEYYERALALDPQHPEAAVEVARCQPESTPREEVAELLERGLAHAHEYKENQEDYILRTVEEVAEERGLHELAGHARRAIEERFPDDK